MERWTGTRHTGPWTWQDERLRQGLSARPAARAGGTGRDYTRAPDTLKLFSQGPFTVLLGTSKLLLLPSEAQKTCKAPTCKPRLLMKEISHSRLPGLSQCRQTDPSRAKGHSLLLVCHQRRLSFMRNWLLRVHSHLPTSSKSKCWAHSQVSLSLSNFRLQRSLLSTEWLAHRQLVRTIQLVQLVYLLLLYI